MGELDLNDFNNNILRLCRRLKSFTLNEIITITGYEKNSLISILQVLEFENKLKFFEGKYIYLKKETVKHNYALFKEYPAIITDIVLRCFCENINSSKSAHIANIGENQVLKFFTIFRTIIYNKQKVLLDSYYYQNPQNARRRNFFNQEVFLYLYKNQVFISETLLSSDNDRPLSIKEKAEFTKIYCYLSRNLQHNKNSYNLNFKIAESLWRRNKSFKELYFDLKELIM